MASPNGVVPPNDLEKLEHELKTARSSDVVQLLLMATRQAKQSPDPRAWDKTLYLIRRELRRRRRLRR